jgi:superfamily I DNA and/or RNA helicase
MTPDSLPDLAWVDEEAAGTDAVTRLLTQSAFEALFPQADPAHCVRFDQQYRMPQAIADFASQYFYDGHLKTAGSKKVYGARHTDPLFRQPLVFVDTSTLPVAQREESLPGQDRTDREAWGLPGYINRLEATLIADIATAYDREGLNWAVIVPYRAQARLIRRELTQRLPSAPGLRLEEQVATVDSFQGGERDRILYGFTRSNLRGQVGFLRELRRLNVAITRAREQLVLVGDALTLTQARDIPFRDLARVLLAHVQQVGELLTHDECQTRLATRRRGVP